MRSVLLDGIIHRNPLLSVFCCFSSFSLLQFPFLLESFDRHVSHHLIPSTTQVSFCTTMLHTVSHASFELFSPVNHYFVFPFDKSLFQASLSLGSLHFFDYRLESFHRTFSSCMTFYVKERSFSSSDPVPYSRTSTTNLRLFILYFDLSLIIDVSLLCISTCFVGSFDFEGFLLCDCMIAH